MKKQWKIIFVATVIIIFTIMLVSCSLPDSNSTDTTPPDQNEPPAPTSLQTVEPGASTPEGIAYSPETRSVLRWVDLSDFVYVPPDEFTMGADSLIFTDFRPAHNVGLGGFWIQQAEVTNQQYALCVAAGECSAPFVEEDVDYWYADPSNANKPVVGVSWYQAQEYCTYIEARLPTEAEWEMTARGTEGRNYPWGDDEPTCDLLNYDDCLDPSEPEDVRSYIDGTSPFEAMDMSGNVFEWVADWYKEDYYPDSPDFNPPGPLESELVTEDKERVLRGGGYATSLDKISPILRFKAKPEEHAADLGFRCVLLGEGADIPLPAPACQVAALGQQPDSGPTITPFVVHPAESYGSCQLDNNGNHHTWVRIANDVDSCWTKRMIDFSINIPNDTSAIACNLDDGLGCGPDYFRCNSPHFFEGATVGINFCYDEDLYLSSSELIPECAAGFAYNSGSGWCEPVSDWLPVPPCPDGYDEVGDLGCLPSHATFEGCPVGYYTLGLMNSIVCIPMDECLLPGAPESCAALVCPPGQSYDADDQCCVAPEPLKAICPTGWYLDSDLLMCVMPTRVIAACETLAITIPYCPTPTPTPTLPPPINCSGLDETSCRNASGCEWVPSAAGLPYCRAK